MSLAPDLPLEIITLIGLTNPQAWRALLIVPSFARWTLTTHGRKMRYSFLVAKEYKANMKILAAGKDLVLCAKIIKKYPKIQFIQIYESTLWADACTTEVIFECTVTKICSLSKYRNCSINLLNNLEFMIRKVVGKPRFEKIIDEPCFDEIVAPNIQSYHTETITLAKKLIASNNI